MKPTIENQRHIKKNTNGQSGKSAMGLSLESWESVVRLAIIIAAVAGGISVTAAFISAFVGSKVSARIQMESNEKIAELNKQVASAELLAAEAKQKAEEEKLARVKLEERVAARRLTKDQQSELGSRLSRFSSQLIGIWYNAGDHEGGIFSENIASALKLAKWIVLEPASILNLAASGRLGRPVAIETGVIVVSTEDKASQNASEA